MRLVSRIESINMNFSVYNNNRFLNVLGGTSLISMGMLVGIALTNIQFLDLKASRNILILGVSLLLGIMFPFWIKDNPGIINTGKIRGDTHLSI